MYPKNSSSFAQNAISMKSMIFKIKSEPLFEYQTNNYLKILNKLIMNKN